MEERDNLRNDHYDDLYGENRYKFSARRFFRTVKVIFIVAFIIFLLLIYNKFKKDSAQLAQTINDTVVGSEGKVITVTETTLTNILKETKLYTAEYPYNGYVPVPTRENPRYYAAYEGVVKAGFDTSKIQVKVNEEQKKITIILPDIEIETPTVNAGTIEYIFEDETANTETVAQEAYRYACSDLKERAENDTQLFDTALQNARSITIQLTQPWLDTEGKGYTVDVITVDEQASEEMTENE